MVKIIVIMKDFDLQHMRRAVLAVGCFEGPGFRISEMSRSHAIWTHYVRGIRSFITRCA